MKKKIEDRKFRFSEGRCPVHGLSMIQIDRWYEPVHGDSYTYVECPRRACKISAKAYGVKGPWKILPEFEALLDTTADDPVFIDPNVAPAPKKKSLVRYKQVVWSKTLGRCYYCGKNLTLERMTIDHFVSEARGGTDSLENLVPSCRSCNSSKGTKSLEEFRFWAEQSKFLLENGVSFSLEQVEYLMRIGVELNIRPHVFWFEKLGTE